MWKKSKDPLLRGVDSNRSHLHQVLISKQSRILHLMSVVIWAVLKFLLQWRRFIVMRFRIVFNWHLFYLIVIQSSRESVQMHFVSHGPNHWISSFCQMCGCQRRGLGSRRINLISLILWCCCGRKIRWAPKLGMNGWRKSNSCEVVEKMKTTRILLYKIVFLFVLIYTI